MITVRMTRAQQRELVRQYRGKPIGINNFLEEGGINLEKNYSQTIEKSTGDLIYTQEEPVIEPEEVIEIIPEMPAKKKKSKKKSKKKGK